MHPIAFQFGPFTIYWYGILTAVGFLVAFWTATRRAPAGGLTVDAVSGLAPWLIVGAIAGARALYVITFWRQEFAGQPWVEIFKIRSGLVYYGGLAGASLATILYARVNRVPLWKLADVIAPGIPLGHAFGRIGCLMTGCCHGRACEWPWAVHFPREHATGGAGVHPTQLYESALNFALFAALAWFFPRRKFSGHVFAVYLLAYAVLRGIVESFRGDYAAEQYRLGVLTPAQLVSIGIFCAGATLWLWLRRHEPGAPAQPAQNPVA